MFNSFISEFMGTPPPLSLYIHIPWCAKKCPYCDFNSHQSDTGYDEDKYINALMHDLDCESELVDQRPIESIFFGGGTPSLFSPESIHKILLGAHEKLNLRDNIETTMEANPGTFEQNNFSEFKSAGINRLSIGIQSFDNDCLQKLGRIHDGHQARSAIDTAQQAGFDNINLDLMFGLPGQTVGQAVNDMEIVCGQNVKHISHYQLTIEENTFFYKHPPVLPDTDRSWDMQTACHNILSDNNYHNYEISAFSKTDYQCRHNLNYWMFGDYIGIGAGAHGKITDTKTSEIVRRWKRRQPEDYMTNNALSGEASLTKKEIVSEFLLNVLRLKNGVSIETFENVTGLKISAVKDACESIDRELLTLDNKRISTTDKGYLFLNNVLEQLL